MERDANLLGHHLGHQTILLPLAVTVQRALGVMPVLHEHGKHVIPLLLKQQSRYAGVHSTRQAYAHFHAAKISTNCPKIRQFQPLYANS